MPEPAQANPSLQELFALGVRHFKVARWREGEAVYRQLVLQQPTFAEAHYNLGLAVLNQGRLEEATAIFRTAIALNPNMPEPWNGLGNALRHTDQPEQAIPLFRRALALKPQYVDVMNNLAGALQELGLLDEALALMDQALTIQPGNAEVHDGRLCMLQYHAAFDAKAIYQAARLWNQQFAAPLANQIPVHGNRRSPNRRLRIGYVSADFHRHCSMLFIAPLLAYHDRSQFEVVAYSNVETRDAVTRRVEGQVDQWRDISGQSDEAVARGILQDRIDILVDLGLHSARGRLGVFARKPAPVQVTWLGYPGTTGLEAIDYRLTDARLDPLGSGEPEIRNPKSEIRINDQNPNDPIPNDPNSPGAVKQPRSLPHSDIGKLGVDSDFGFRISDFATKESYYSELSLRLPDCFWCYDPRGMEDVPGKDMAMPGPLPLLVAGQPTLGCLNKFCKVTDATLALWAQVMAALPTARLLLLAPLGQQRRRILQRLGVDERRVEFVVRQNRRPYLDTYRRIDLCLDTIPYNGHTTTLDALWMGAPVVTRVGHTVVGRAGWSLLYQVGLTDLVARSDGEFVETAVGLAGNVARLTELRATLRARMEQSPLMDGRRFTGNVESAYGQMWRAWCEGN